MFLHASSEPVTLLPCSPKNARGVCVGCLDKIPAGAQHLSISYGGTLRRISQICHQVIAETKTSPTQGRVLRVGVLGGSVSAGGGCSTGGWVSHVLSLLQQVLECDGLDNLQVEVQNKAAGSTGSTRAFLCYSALFSDWEPDILLLEYGINDVNGDTLELLLRSLPQHTAPVLVDVFSLRQGFSSAQFDHDALARYYDVPLVSIRDAFWPLFANNLSAKEAWFADDHHHPSCEGHLQIAQLVVHFLAHVLNVGKPVAYPTVPLYQLSSQPPLSRLSAKYPEEYYAQGVLPTCEVAPMSTDWYELPTEVVNPNINQGWSEHMDEYKPYIGCTSPNDGEVILLVKCTPALKKDSCALIVSYTLSWLPMGKAKFTLPSNVTTTFEISAHARNWRTENRKWTVMQWHKFGGHSFRVPSGSHRLRVGCTGTTDADANVESPYNRTEFRLHGFVVL